MGINLTKIAVKTLKNPEIIYAVNLITVNKHMSDNQTQTPSVNLSVKDIAMLKQIVEVASSRGAFQAEELTTVGAVYDKIKTWLDEVNPQPESSETDEGESDA